MKNVTVRKTNSANGNRLEKPFAKTTPQAALQEVKKAVQEEPEQVAPPKVEVPTVAAEQGTTQEQAAQVATPEQVTPPQAEPQQAAPPKVLTFEEMQARLNAEIERVNHKNSLTKKRKNFVNCLESLTEYTKKLQDETEFETTNGKITFQLVGAENFNSRNRYDDSFSITNTALIIKFSEFLVDEIKIKIAELETEILKP